MTDQNIESGKSIAETPATRMRVIQSKMVPVGQSCADRKENCSLRVSRDWQNARYYFPLGLQDAILRAALGRTAWPFGSAFLSGPVLGFVEL